MYGKSVGYFPSFWEFYFCAKWLVYACWSHIVLEYALTIVGLIDLGWDAPAGQMYSSANDLAQLLKLIFRPEDPYNTTTGQVGKLVTH